MRYACLALLALLLLPAPAQASQLAPADYRVGPRERRVVPAAIAELVPASLRPLLERGGASRRPKPGTTSMFEPKALVPLVGAHDALEVGLGFGQAPREQGRGAFERARVVVVYVAMDL